MQSSSEVRFDQSSDGSTKRSTYSDDSVGYSINTRLTAATASSSSSAISQTGPGNARRRNPKSAPVRGFKTASDVPPLDFGDAGLVGRGKEISTLKSCYDRLMKEGRKELILVGGHSGSGKSSLIKSMENDISFEGLFVEGKFDMNTSNEPYSGVAKAFGIICRTIKEAGPETIAELRQDLRKELGDKPGMLVQLIPELQDIMVVHTDNDPNMGSICRADEAEGGVDRLRFAFRVLTQVKLPAPSSRP